MAEQPGGKDDAGGGSKPQSLMERLERSASTLYQLAEEVVPGVCLMSDAPQQSLRQAAGDLRQMMAELSVVTKLTSELKSKLHYTNTCVAVIGEHLPRDPRQYTAENVSEFQDLLADVRQAARLMAEEAGQLHALFRGKPVDFRLGPVDLWQATDTALKILSTKFKGRIEVVRAEGDIPAVWMTPASLLEVLVNLLDSAAHALLDGQGSERRITLSTEVTEETVKLLVADTGPELSEDVFPFLWTHSRSWGLSVCRSILGSFGGTLSVRSQVEEGTTVEVVFRRADRPHSPE
jgi:C4-dicarboxylate-specific signal transduction histidine kinase